MCVAVPAFVKSIEGNLARVEIGGIVREVSIRLTPKVQAGDYVIVHTGYAINVLDQAEGEETLRLFEEIARTADGER
ncbi:MAG: HypC/HybG/HupF family hydrogenase formation chaperone [Candidatus Bipolaricaulota bacterium]|nr:HypC/HybG/HupF family hydrogenase formation chaperone [Candidatus Bipolaricaulota bacterium]